MGSKLIRETQSPFVAFVLALKMMCVLLREADDPETTPKALLWARLSQHITYMFQLLYWIPVKQNIDNKIAIFVLPATA